MRNLFLEIGFTLAGIGAGLLSPLVDFLPMKLLPYLNGHFTGSGSGLYFRVVPSTASGDPTFLAFALLLAGAFVVALAMFLRWRQKLGDS